MLNLALMTLSTSSLERRIGMLRETPKASPWRLGSAFLGLALLVMIACSSTVPDTPIAAIVDEAVRPDSSVILDPAISYERLGQVLRNSLNGKVRNGEHYWLLFNHDWTVRQVDIGPEGRIEVPTELAREFNKKIPGPIYSLNASIDNKYPEMRSVRTPGAKAGGAVYRFGGDTVSVYWGRL